MKFRTFKRLCGMAVMVLFAAVVHPSNGWSDYSVLYVFDGYPSDGAKPYGSLVYDSTYLYGMTSQGGSHGAGTIFKAKKNGSGRTILYSFTGGTDGGTPFGNLVLSGSTLYGMTSSGGANSAGVVFKVETDGSDYTILHPFAPKYSDGAYPHGSLILSGSTLYGMTCSGGSGTSCAQRCGTIFKLKTSGGGHSVLHSFTDWTNDGAKPNYGSLILSGSTLYGMTSAGGSADDGTIFKISTGGSGFSLLHSFGDGRVSNDGYSPFGSLILSGSTLYGMTAKGGEGNFGTIFKVNTSGRGYSILHSFLDGTVKDDGYTPYGSLILSGAILFGMTSSGGGADDGTIFQIDTDGDNYSLLHQFGDGTVTDDGGTPYGDPTLIGSTLYGMTSTHQNTGYSGYGIIFALTDAVVVAPGAPRAVKATAGNAKATVAFKAPTSNGGSPITSYEVTSSPGNIRATGKKSPITVTGLTNGKTYTFTVKATNKAGTGPASAQSNRVEPVGPPGAPRAVKATAGNAKATVAFKAPASDGGSPITSYTAVSTPGGITAKGKRSPIVVKGLTNGETYTFKVRATNKYGTSPGSLKSNKVTPSE